MLATRAFGPKDQVEFARLSGDANPMHLDAVAARRTLAGEPVVHGVHLLLWALERIAATGERLEAKALRADFRSFLPVGRKAGLGAPVPGPWGLRASVICEGVVVLTLEVGARARDHAVDVRHNSREIGAAAAPLALALDDIESLSGRLASPTAEAAATAFPHASAWLGDRRVAALLACTHLVGMVCPGLHSIFNRIDVSLTPEAPGSAGLLAWAATTLDRRFGRVTLGVRAPGIEGLLVASVRPAPVRQESFEVLAARVAPDAFRRRRPLVVGGSRGLGETTAKLLAAGGATVTLTYARGQDDAERVAGEIRRHGGACTVIRYDALEDAPAQLSSVGALTSAYYFATGPIFTARSASYDRARLSSHLAIYVDGFHSLYLALMEKRAELNLYYPSSVAVEERPPGLTEYAMAKCAGELLCGDLNRAQPAIRIMTSRLPRTATDQTSSLIASEAAASSDVMLPVIEKVEHDLR